MSNVYIAEERHGYNFVFSTYEKAFEWLKKEIKDNDVTLDMPEVDYDETDESVYVYYDGNLVACFDEYEVDKIE